MHYSNVNCVRGPGAVIDNFNVTPNPCSGTIPEACRRVLIGPVVLPSKPSVFQSPPSICPSRCRIAGGPPNLEGPIYTVPVDTTGWVSNDPVAQRPAPGQADGKGTTARCMRGGFVGHVYIVQDVPPSERPHPGPCFATSSMSRRQVSPSSPSPPSPPSPWAPRSRRRRRPTCTRPPPPATCTPPQQPP